MHSTRIIQYSYDATINFALTLDQVIGFSGLFSIKGEDSPLMLGLADRGGSLTVQSLVMFLDFPHRKHTF